MKNDLNTESNSHLSPEEVDQAIHNKNWKKKYLGPIGKLFLISIGYLILVGILCVFLIEETTFCEISMNIFENIFGLISYDDSLLPSYLYVSNVVFGIFFTVFVIGIVFNAILDRKNPNSED